MKSTIPPPAGSGVPGPQASEGWDTLYADHLSRIYNYFRFRVGPYEDIEELTARTFERAWRSRHRYRQDRGAFAAWLFAIARNIAADHLRERALAVRMQPLLEAPEPAQAPTPEEEAERRSNAARLARLVAALGESHREILALKYGAALTNRRIAELVEITESNVGTTLQRIIEKLRALW